MSNTPDPRIESAGARRFRSMVRMRRQLRIRAPGPATILTLAVLGLFAFGIAGLAGPYWAAIIVASLLALLTPIGAAVRILLRGK